MLYEHLLGLSKKAVFVHIFGCWHGLNLRPKKAICIQVCLSLLTKLCGQILCCTRLHEKLLKQQHIDSARTLYDFLNQTYDVISLLQKNSSLKLAHPSIFHPELSKVLQKCKTAVFFLEKANIRIMIFSSLFKEVFGEYKKKSLITFPSADFLSIHAEVFS